MLRNFKRKWHKFWYFNFNYKLDTSSDHDHSQKYLEKSHYHGKKLMQLL
jgi:hypothetical protein